MFTGIIEEVGTVTKVNNVSSGMEVTIATEIILHDVKLGDSISINGACQTVISFSNKEFTVYMSDETIKITTFNNIKVNDKVNLERALKLSDRLGGHLVSGHIDSTAKLYEIRENGASTILTFSVPETIFKYIVYKGSVCINGISLTVSNINELGKLFSVTVIPHTLKNTNLHQLKPGVNVNLETDLLAKYIEKLLLKDKTSSNKISNVTYEFLSEHGFT